MTTLTEGNLKITFPADVKARKFDDASHGLSHCMKAVDFIAELKNRYYFIEFKDPYKPGVPQKDREEYVKKFLAGNIDEDFKYKCRDTFLYEWASKRVGKPIHYLVLVAIDTLSDAELLARTDDLKRKIPLNGPASSSWKRSFIAGCAVFNIAAWNKQMSAYPVSRMP
jgi:hypothetical protein